MVTASDKSSPTPKAHSRWFRPRYSLATLFVVMTVFGCVLGWVCVQLKWIHDRRELLTHHGAYAYDPFDDWGPRTSAPGLLWLFGEKGMCYVVVISDDAEVANRLYPEAEVQLNELQMHVDANPIY